MHFRPRQDEIEEDQDQLVPLEEVEQAWEADQAWETDQSWEDSESDMSLGQVEEENEQQDQYDGDDEDDDDITQ